RLDEEAAKKLQAEFDEEERLVREKAKKEERTNIALTEEWDDIQAKIDVDHQVIDLETTKTTQQNEIATQQQEIASLKRKVKMLEKRNRSRTHKLKRIYKVGLSAKVESSSDEESLVGEEVFVAGKNENVVEEVVDAAQDKGKGILIEEPVKPKKKDQIRLDEEAAKKLQAEFDEEERLVREKAKKEERTNIALTEEWDDIQAKIDVDHQFAK
nr:hypothetical protein [Tanacetum cinerariifolium]